MNKEKTSVGTFGKLVSLVLSLMLIISMSAFPALAAEDDSLFVYEDYGDTIEITGYNGDDRDTMTELVIPAEIDGKSVTEIGYSAFEDCTSLESVTIPEGVTDIGGYAFYNCTSLTSVTIPEGVDYIGYSAFEDCTSLKSVTIPKSVTYIDDQALGYCNGYYDEIDDCVYYDKVDGFKITGYKYSAAYFYARDNGFDFESLGEVNPFAYDELGDGTLEIIGYLGDDSDLVIPAKIDGKQVTGIGNDAFYGGISFESVTIPEGVAYIGSYAFSGCASLESVTIPESVTSIGYSVFEDCTNLKSVTIPEGVTSIENDDFSGCASLENVTIPEGVTSIENDAFWGCTSLKSVTIPKSVTYIGSEAFGYYLGYYQDMETYDTKKVDGFKIIGYKNSAAYVYARDNGFEFESLGEISPFDYDELEDGTLEIIDYYGDDRDTMTNLVIPAEIDGKKVTSIGGSAFYECTSLKSVTISEGVTEIGYDAFVGCTSLTSVTIPESVTSIGGGAFYDCTSLKSVTIPKSVTDIGNYRAFGYCNGHYDENYDYVYDKVDGFKITGYKYSAAYAYARDNGFDFESLGEVNPFAYDELEDGTLEIVAYYGDDSDMLTDLVIPAKIDGKQVTGIGNNAFYGGISFESVTIPEGVAYIGSDAFSDCASLESVTISEGVTIIERRAFANCLNLKSIRVPKSVTSIGRYALGFEFIAAGEDIYEKLEDFKIEGYAGTAAEEYANYNGLEFIALEEKSGDINGDGELDLSDSTILERHLAQFNGYETIDESVADVNQDGKVNLFDSTILERHLAKWSGYETLPYNK